ncbi:hypothetical protein BU24DRAFT_425827 [Aaosphaeria arxii CBS 175.79]|uniref:Uncharacterized protein n=1 Tax=Aaosphaeria arxii CBS 175.79 TaxID=1450172 RepID=A0A6A5XI56_9PLEO|nr:uncharacterized protein BU24DRAFT_425827 [Aaosphaeria arxii CBS 175.79]KAF2012004.1 hypothetical protein BU24DRAFT_425827 [Aaosphaeria arxii CBS 175.79]
MSGPVPVILAGAVRAVATKVKANLLPEYDAVYASHDLASAQREIPLIISGTLPSSPSLHSQLGSNDFTKPPRAIILGGAWSDQAFQDLKDACAQACDSRDKVPVPFFRADNKLTQQLWAEKKGPAQTSHDYAEAIASRLKAKLREVGIAPDIQEDGSKHGRASFCF